MSFSTLGTDTHTGQRVDISQFSRRQGVYIIGANGTGKSGLIENLIIQDIAQGLGVCLLDPRGDVTNSVLARLPGRESDVILLDIADADHPFGINIFECPNPQSPKEVQKVVDQVMHIFDKLYDVNRSTPSIAHYLQNCTYTLVANPGYTLADMSLLLTNEAFRRSLAANVTDSTVQLFWETYNSMKPSEQREQVESTVKKLDELLSPLLITIIGQAKTTVNMRQVMDEGKILLVKLDAQCDRVISLIGSMIIAKILQVAYSRATVSVDKHTQWNVYADEFQRFATENLATLLTDARDCGIATTIAHQTRDQLTNTNRGSSLQAANVIVFQVTGSDAQELASSFSTIPASAATQREAVQMISQDPVEHLLSYGHKNPAVSQFVQHILAPLKRDMNALTNDTCDVNQKENQHVYQDKNAYYSSLFLLQDGYDCINQYFVLLMDRSTLLYDKKEIVIIFNILYHLRAWIGWRPGVIKKYTGFQSYAYEPIDFYEEEKELFTHFLTYTFLSLKAGHEGQQDQFLEQGLSLSSEGFYATRAYYAKTQLQPEAVNRATEEDINKWLHERAIDEVNRLVTFMSWLIQTAHYLHDDPILVNSREREEEIVSSQDNTNEQDGIVSYLANLPPFTARVKIAGDIQTFEHTIQTLAPQQGIEKTALQQRILTIQGQNKADGYTRERSVVEAEISQRQQGYLSGNQTLQQPPQQ